MLGFTLLRRLSRRAGRTRRRRLPAQWPRPDCAQPGRPAPARRRPAAGRCAGCSPAGSLGCATFFAADWPVGYVAASAPTLRWADCLPVRPGRAGWRRTTPADATWSGRPRCRPVHWVGEAPRVAGWPGCGGRPSRSPCRWTPIRLPDRPTAQSPAPAVTGAQDGSGRAGPDAGRGRPGPGRGATAARPAGAAGRRADRWCPWWSTRAGSASTSPAARCCRRGAWPAPGRSTWRPGTRSRAAPAAPAPATLAVLGSLGTVLSPLGGPHAAVAVLLLGDAPLAGLLAYAGHPPAARAPRGCAPWSPPATRCCPPATAAVAQGRLDVVVVHLLLPPVLAGVVAAARTGASATRGCPRWRPVAIGLAVIGAFAPAGARCWCSSCALVGFVVVPGRHGDGRARVAALFARRAAAAGAAAAVARRGAGTAAPAAVRGIGNAPPPASVPARPGRTRSGRAGSVAGSASAGRGWPRWRRGRARAASRGAARVGRRCARRACHRWCCDGSRCRARRLDDRAARFGTGAPD